MNITTDSPLYQKAFEQYLRRGTPIEVSLKALMTKAAETSDNHSTPLYIWRTVGDDQVRDSHAANEGKIFRWDNPPDTGNPGDAINCRCTAEPYRPKIDEYVRQRVISIVDEGLNRWEWYDFVSYFYFGKGHPVRLSHIGHLQDVINQASKMGVNQVFERIEEQIIEQARRLQSGSFVGSSSNSYDFSKVSFVHGNSTVSTQYEGQVHPQQGALIINATIHYAFEDVFTDPLSIRERNLGTSTLSEAVNVHGELGGTPYRIYGVWTTALDALVNADPE